MKLQFLVSLPDRFYTQNMFNIDLIRSCLEALFCCRGRIEIKNLFSWLLKNNLRGVEIFFEIQKPRLFYFKDFFFRSEMILQQTRKRMFIS